MYITEWTCAFVTQQNSARVSSADREGRVVSRSEEVTGQSVYSSTVHLSRVQRTATGSLVNARLEHLLWLSYRIT